MKSDLIVLNPFSWHWFKRYKSIRYVHRISALVHLWNKPKRFSNHKNALKFYWNLNLKCVFPKWEEDKVNKKKKTNDANKWNQPDWCWFIPLNIIKWKKKLQFCCDGIELDILYSFAFQSTTTAKAIIWV